MRKNIQEKFSKMSDFFNQKRSKNTKKCIFWVQKSKIFPGEGPRTPAHWQASPAFLPTGKNSCGEPWQVPGQVCLQCQFMSPTGKVLHGLITVMCVCVCVCVCVCFQVYAEIRSRHFQAVVPYLSKLSRELPVVFDVSCSLMFVILSGSYWMHSHQARLCVQSFFLFFFRWGGGIIQCQQKALNVSSKKKKKKNERKKAIAVPVVFHCYSALVTFASSSGHSGLHLEKHSCLAHRHTMSKYLQTQLVFWEVKFTHTHTHTHTHTRTHARTHARTHTRTHAHQP